MNVPPGCHVERVSPPRYIAPLKQAAGLSYARISNLSGVPLDLTKKIILRRQDTCDVDQMHAIMDVLLRWAERRAKHPPLTCADPAQDPTLIGV